MHLAHILKEHISGFAGAVSYAYALVRKKETSLFNEDWGRPQYLPKSFSLPVSAEVFFSYQVNG